MRARHAQLDAATERRFLIGLERYSIREGENPSWLMFAPDGAVVGFKPIKNRRSVSLGCARAVSGGSQARAACQIRCSCALKSLLNR